MDSRAALLQEKEVELVRILARDTDISVYEAERFVPEAGTAVIEAIAARGGELDLEDPTGASNVRSLLGIIDVAYLGTRTGVSPQKAATGLVAMIPRMLGFLDLKAGEPIAWRVRTARSREVAESSAVWRSSAVSCSPGERHPISHTPLPPLFSVLLLAYCLTT